MKTNLNHILIVKLNIERPFLPYFHLDMSFMTNVATITPLWRIFSNVEQRYFNVIQPPRIT